MENIGTPLEDLQAANAQSIAANRDRNDETGCFYRFIAKFDPNELSAFIRAEADRGLDMPRLVEGVAQGLAYHLVCVAIMSTDEHATYRDLVIRTQQYAVAMMTGMHGVETVNLRPDGSQQEKTVAGVFQRGAAR